MDNINAKKELFFLIESNDLCVDCITNSLSLSSNSKTLPLSLSTQQKQDSTSTI